MHNSFSNMERAQVLTQALPYIKHYNGEIVVVKYGGNAMINEDCKDKDALALVKYISEEQKEEKLLANQQVIKTPIIRNGKNVKTVIMDDCPALGIAYMFGKVLDGSGTSSGSLTVIVTGTTLTEGSFPNWDNSYMTLVNEG